MSERLEPMADVEQLLAELAPDGPLIGILLAEESDRQVMHGTAMELQRRGISFELKLLPPHTDPRGVAEYASTAVLRGLRVLICASGHAASLPGIVASYSELPVIGVPIRSADLGGMDALLSTVQQPLGSPVGCMAIDGAVNAAIFAAKVLGQGMGGRVQEL